MLSLQNGENRHIIRSNVVDHKIKLADHKIKLVDHKVKPSGEFSNFPFKIAFPFARNVLFPWSEEFEKKESPCLEGRIVTSFREGKLTKYHFLPQRCVGHRVAVARNMGPLLVGVSRGNTIRGNRTERFWEGNLPLRGSLRGSLRGRVFRGF